MPGNLERERKTRPEPVPRVRGRLCRPAPALTPPLIPNFLAEPGARCEDAGPLGAQPGMEVVVGEAGVPEGHGGGWQLSRCP